MKLLCLLFGHRWLTYRKGERHCKRCNAWEVEFNKVNLKKGCNTLVWKRMKLKI